MKKDVYQLTTDVIIQVARVLNLPSFAVSIAVNQIRNIPQERLRSVLYIIYSELDRNKEVFMK